MRSYVCINVSNFCLFRLALVFRRKPLQRSAKLLQERARVVCVLVDAHPRNRYSNPVHVTPGTPDFWQNLNHTTMLNVYTYVHVVKMVLRHSRRRLCEVE